MSKSMTKSKSRPDSAEVRKKLRAMQDILQFMDMEKVLMERIYDQEIIEGSEIAAKYYKAAIKKIEEMIVKNIKTEFKKEITRPYIADITTFILKSIMIGNVTGSIAGFISAKMMADNIHKESHKLIEGQISMN